MFNQLSTTQQHSCPRRSNSTGGERQRGRGVYQHSTCTSDEIAGFTNDRNSTEPEVILAQHVGHFHAVIIIVWMSTAKKLTVL